jgi:4-hydroxy-tetrahydrodipicolinate reductase
MVLSGACGKMGRVIAELTVAERPGLQNCSVCAGVDVSGVKYADFPVYAKMSDLREDADVVVDFSHPSALPDLLSYCENKNIPAVIATTGYERDEVRRIESAAEKIPVFFTFNMSLGINLLTDLAKRAARVLGAQFDVEIIERHHNLKKDAPSGTALMLAEAVNGEFGGQKRYVYDRHAVRGAREKDEIGIHALRGGTIVGEHEIVFAGHDEVVALSHSALSKEVFAVGAINAALFLKNQKKGLYGMCDLLADA